MTAAGRRSQAPPGHPLTALLGFLDRELTTAFGDEPYATLERRARSLPLDLTRLVGFEVPLSPPGSGVDLLLQLAPAASLRRLLAGDPELALTLGGGRELADLLSALVDVEHPLFARVGDAWLEYDTGSGAAQSPSLFAGPGSSEAASALAALLCGGTLPAAVNGPVDRLVRTLGPNDRIQQLGVMDGRRDAPLRFVLKAAGNSSGPDVRALVRAGWRGLRAELDRVLARYAALVPMHSLAIGLERDGEVPAPVGIELHLPYREDAERLLSVLCADGLAGEIACERLLAWHGHALDEACAASPTAFWAVPDLTRGRYMPAVVRRLHHVKLSLAPGRPVGAKAYLGASIRLC
jgi:hypothetical protein